MQTIIVSDKKLSQNLAFAISEDDKSKFIEFYKNKGSSLFIEMLKRIDKRIKNPTVVFDLKGIERKKAEYNSKFVGLIAFNIHGEMLVFVNDLFNDYLKTDNNIYVRFYRSSERGRTDGSIYLEKFMTFIPNFQKLQMDSDFITPEYVKNELETARKYVDSSSVHSYANYFIFFENIGSPETMNFQLFLDTLDHQTTNDSDDILQDQWHTFMVGRNSIYENKGIRAYEKTYTLFRLKNVEESKGNLPIVIKTNRYETTIERRQL